MHEDFGDYSLDFWLHQRAPTGRNHGVTVNAQRERASDQEK
jgi:hypothetical protein